MDTATQTLFTQLRGGDGAARMTALSALLEATRQPVDWAYAEWDALLADLREGDNHQRTIAAQLLCSLAKSDPEGRLLRDLDAIMQVTHDPRFVTARHTIQALWNAGLGSRELRVLLLNKMAARFAEAASEKNGTLVRFDLAQGLRRLYDATRDEAVRERALALIETEPDLKYRKKYAALWKQS